MLNTRMHYYRRRWCQLGRKRTSSARHFCLVLESPHGIRPDEPAPSASLWGWLDGKDGRLYRKTSPNSGRKTGKPLHSSSRSRQIDRDKTPSAGYLSAVRFCCSLSLLVDSCACPGSPSAHSRPLWPSASLCCPVDPAPPQSPSAAAWLPSLCSRRAAAPGQRNSGACTSLRRQRMTGHQCKREGKRERVHTCHSRGGLYRHWTHLWVGSPVRRTGSVCASWAVCASVRDSCCCPWTWGCWAAAAFALEPSQLAPHQQNVLQNHAGLELTARSRIILKHLHYYHDLYH